MFQILEQQNSLKDLTIVEFCLLDGSIIAGQCGEGSKLGCTVPHRHPRMMFWLVMWQIGDVVAYLEGASGRYIRMSTFHAGNMFAPAFLFAQERRYPVTVQATTNTKVLRIHSADFERLLELDSRLTKNFAVILSNLIAGLTKKVGMLLLSVRDKIVFFLKEEQRRQQSNTIQLSMSRHELADHFGIQKYSLQRALNELQESGAIRIDGKTIEILKL